MSKKQKEKFFSTHWSDNCRRFGPLIETPDTNMSMPFFYIKADTREEAEEILNARIKEVFGEQTPIAIDPNPISCQPRPAFMNITKLDDGESIFAGSVRKKYYEPQGVMIPRETEEE